MIITKICIPVVFMSGGGEVGGGSGHGHPMLPPQGQGGAQQRVGEPPGQSCKLYSN